MNYSFQCIYRYDLGRNVDVPFIPLFGLSDDTRGTVYPMLHNFGEGHGSVKFSLQSSDEDISSVNLKVYPNLVHFLKSNGLNQEMPQTLRGIRTRLGQLQTLLLTATRAHPSLLCGFRLEFELRIVVQQLLHMIPLLHVL